jgi:hypothetical protein
MSSLKEFAISNDNLSSVIFSRREGFFVFDLYVCVVHGIELVLFYLALLNSVC